MTIYDVSRKLIEFKKGIGHMSHMKVSVFTAQKPQGVVWFYEAFTFPGGEEHIRFLEWPESIKFSEDIIRVELFVQLTTSTQIMRLLLLANALRIYTCLKGVPLELKMPYFPYARQDRVCLEGEALSIKVMANLINSLDFQKVTVWDVHSTVSLALLENVHHIPQHALIEAYVPLKQLLSRGEVTLLSPDAGAMKKTQQLSQYFGGFCSIIQAEKCRDLKTGQIIHTQIMGEITNKHILIADDICDGGRTFIEIAKILREKSCLSISLLVTHGIFSKGFKVFDGLIDHIYTTTSFKNWSAEDCDGQSVFHVIDKVFD